MLFPDPNEFERASPRIEGERRGGSVAKARQGAYRLFMKLWAYIKDPYYIVWLIKRRFYRFLAN